MGLRGNGFVDCRGAVWVPKQCFLPNCMPQERSTQRNGAGSGAAPQAGPGAPELTGERLGALCWPRGAVEHG